MRLKEIEARLAEIKEELNTRAAELTDEEITKLETEVTDLQEERTALLAAAEKRKKLLERIAAGEPTGGAGADATLLRNFKGAGGAGVGEPEDKYDTMAYRKAFMNYVCRGVAIPAEYRAAETTTTADSGADFDLGDRITCKETKWGIQIDARITEVTETYQKGEETIEATFGDSLPTLVDQIRKVR